MTTGPPTRNIDSGSGGDKKAPAARAENQSNDLLSVISSDVRKPARIIMNANNGTWKPTADAVKSPRINPSQEPTCQVASMPADEESSTKYSNKKGIRTLFAYVSPSTPNPMDEVVTIASFNGVLSLIADLLALDITRLPLSDRSPIRASIEAPRARLTEIFNFNNIIVRNCEKINYFLEPTNSLVTTIFNFNSNISLKIIFKFRFSNDPFLTRIMKVIIIIISIN